MGQAELDLVDASDTLRVVSRRRLLAAVLVLLVALGVSAVAGCDYARRDAKARERAKIMQFEIRDRRPQGGILDARAGKDNLLDLRIFVSGAGAPGGVVHIRGYGLSAPVKQQPPDRGYYARLRFRTIRLGRFEVLLERPHVNVGYLTVTRVAPEGY
jgi:hypothetical protein